MSDWAKLKVVDLKAELKRRGLPQHGLKSELVARLDEADEENDDETAAVSQGEDQDMAEDAAPNSNHEDEAEANPLQASAAQESIPATIEVDIEERQAVDEVAENGDLVVAQDDPMDTEVATAEAVQIDAQDMVIDAETAPEAIGQENLPTPKIESPSHASPGDELPSVPIDELDGEEGSKRKRRSRSLSPNEESVRKRARGEGDGPTIAPDVLMEHEQKNEESTHAEAVSRDAATTQQPPEDAADNGRPSVPAVHPATSALYISSLMRPLRPDEMRMHLIDLATPPGASPCDDMVITFFLDQVRTHCLVVFASTSAASRVRSQLHNVVWPNESNRKPLWVDFVPPEEVADWIEKEESAGRTGPRYEVIYRDNADGSVTAALDAVTPSGPGNHPPSGPSNPSSSSRRPVPAAGPNSIPVGPRAFRDLQAPTGPRPKRSGPGPRPAPVVGGPVHRTRCGPSIEYRLADEELARRRLASLRGHYASDTPRRNRGDDLNRYTFENGDCFVDRGREVFEGIRPPHRERANRGGDRRGGDHGFRRGGRGWRGGRGARPRSDRYLPGSTYGGRDN